MLTFKPNAKWQTPSLKCMRRSFFLLSTDEIITSRFGTSNLVSFYVTRQFRSPTMRLPRALTETKLTSPKSRGYYFIGTKGRQHLILPSFEEKIYQYITGVVKEYDQKLIAVNGMPDHIHIFIGFKPSIKISDIVGDIKTASSKYIKRERFLPSTFAWQDGYGCFTYAHSQLDVVAKYVMNQKVHHQKRTFRQEYLEMLQKAGVEYDERYLFEFYDQ